jgi:5-formyltetrahydrofolate cyclo-ligase
MSLSKPVLRQTMRARLREQLSGREVKSAQICRHIAQLPEFRAARTVALYDAMASEPSLALLWPFAPKIAAYPRVQGDELLLFAVFDPAHLAAGSRPGAQREPAAEGERIAPESLDLILVPGLAFTRAGLRMGRGGGHYDRLLALLPATTVRVGISFELQIVEELPAEPHDMTMQVVATEVGVWRA